MLLFFLKGVAAGILTGVPIGPANVAVINTAYRHTFRRAISVGIGAAVADAIYALIGILGVGPLLQRNPGVPPILEAASGVVLLAYGFLTARSRGDQSTADDDTKARSVVPSTNMVSGFFLGFVLIVLNPGAVITWVVIVSTYIEAVSNADGIAAVLGIGAGSLAWFSFVAYLAFKGQKVMGEKAFYLTRIVGILLMIFGVYLEYKAFSYWFW